MLFTLSYAQHLVVEHNVWATTTRHFMYRATEHLSNGPMIDHIKHENHEYKKIKIPAHETNKDLCPKRHKYLWICRLGMLNKLSNKGLNKLMYDPNFHSNTDI